MKNPFGVIKINENTWIIEAKTFYYQGLMYVLAGKERAMVIDASLNIGDFAAVVRSVTNLPTELYITHGHADHVGCAHQFGAARISERDLPVLAAHTDPAYLRKTLLAETPRITRILFPGVVKTLVKTLTAKLPPCEWLPMPRSIDLGGRVIDVIETPGHTSGGVCFLDRAARLIFTGDTLCDWGVLLHFEYCESLAAYRESLARLKALEPEFDAVYCGHHGYPVKAGALDRYIECADGVMVGKITPKPDKFKLNAFCGDIRITLPKSFSL